MTSVGSSQPAPKGAGNDPRETSNAIWETAHLQQFAPQKILQHLDRIKEYLDTGDTVPITVEVDPSNACNHHCLRCTFEDYHELNVKRLSKEVLFALADDFADMGVKAVVWTGGGEPLVNRGCLEAFIYYHGKGLAQGIATNGSLVTPAHNEVFADRFVYARFSVDAASKAMHRTIHGSNDFERITKNIESLCRARDAAKRPNGDRLTVGFSFLAHPENYKEIYDATRLARDLGVDYIQIKPVVMHRKDQIDHSYFTSCLHYIHTARDLETDSFRVLALEYKFNDLLMGSYNRTYSFCWGHPFMTTVSADGYVNFCCHTRGLKEYTFGNVNKDRFTDIWAGEERREAIDRMRRDGLTNCPPNCKYHMINQTLEQVLTSQVGAHTDFL
ncbi:radical SAM protein [Candidatus Woesearchaeota archaeon]|nr:radical SAM protein [Candidatus Woesearchaeota archaeon]